MDIIRAVNDRVVRIQRITPDDTMRLKLGAEWPRAVENARHVEAYAMHYRSDGKLIAGFMVVPSQPVAEPLPCVVYNRGGAADFGMVTRGMLLTHLAEVARAGYAVIGSQYPGNSLSEGHDERGGYSDLRSVIDVYEQIIRPVDALDETRTSMYGFSRGGMMTYQLLRHVGWVRRAVVLGGLADLFRNIDQRPEMAPVLKTAFGGTEAGMVERSAVRWPEKINPNVPLLMVHGQSDWRVSPQDSQDMYHLLISDANRLLLYDGDDHAVSKNRASFHDELIAWLGAG